MFEALAHLLVYRLAGPDAATRFGAAVHFFVVVLAMIFALLVLGIYLIGLTRARLSPERVR